MDKVYIIKEIVRTAKENNGVPLGSNKFVKETGIRRYDWLGKYWAKWSDAIIEAGLMPNKLQVASDEKWLIEQIISFIREIKKFPSSDEVRLKAHNSRGFPYQSTISGRFGNQRQLAERIVEYCENRIEYSDIIGICSGYLDTIASKNEASSQINSNEDKTYSKSQNDFGYVYLMKSGRFYKIGNSNNVERRNYDLGIKLPESINILHKIQTDDPNGIEKYWHERFADKRKKGEWFDLSNSDISAFKRRKFM